MISNRKEIQLYLHCGLCLSEKVRADIEVGWTPEGLQVWCRNHDCNIIHIDFEGQVHPSNDTAHLGIKSEEGGD